MRNRASAREKRRKESKSISHGEFSWIRLSLWFIIFTGLICLLSNCGFDQDAQNSKLFVPGKVEQFTLDNGMSILFKPESRLPMASLVLVVGAGSAQQGNLNGSGLAHLTEHMVFKGAAGYGPGEIFRKIESYGGTINAFTSYDYTGYKISLPSEFIVQALEVLSVLVSQASFEPEELTREKAVVGKEIRLNYDSAQRYISRLLWQAAYLQHPYQYPILGERDLFDNLTRKDLLEFYQKYYRPNNMTLAVVGDLQSEQLIAAVQEVFQNLTPGSIGELNSAPEPGQTQLRTRQEKFTAGLTYLSLGFHSVAITNQDVFALDVLAAILGEGESSRLYNLICQQKNLAYRIEAINYTPRQPGLLIISAVLEEKDRTRVQAAISEQIELVKTNPVSAEELNRAKNKIISSILFHHQTQAAQAMDLALNQAILGDFKFTEHYLQQIEQVQPQDVLRVARSYLTEQNLNIVALIPDDRAQPTEVKQIPGDQFNLGVENLLPQEQQPLKIKRHQLDNGLTLLIGVNRDFPLVSLKAVFKGGLRAERQDLNGISNLVAAMLDKGTPGQSVQQIARLVENQGAQLSYFSGNNSFGLELDLLSRDLDQMLPLFADLILHSSFPQREFDLQKQKNLAELKIYQDDIFKSGKKLLKTTLYQKHPYRFPVIGNQQSLTKLTRQQALAFYRQLCVGENMVLAVFGDVAEEEILSAVQVLFADLESTSNYTISPEPEPPIEQVRNLTQTMDKQQTLILFGFPGVTVFNQDRYALELICQILAQSSGKLFTEIREKAGSAYTLGAYPVVALDPGFIVIYVATSAENLASVKQEIINQLELLKENLLPEQELTQAKRILLSKRMLARQTNSAIALESTLDELYGLGYDHYLEYPQLINRLGAQDIQKATQQYFNLDKYALVVLGP